MSAAAQIPSTTEAKLAPGHNNRTPITRPCCCDNKRTLSIQTALGVVRATEIDGVDFGWWRTERKKSNTNFAAVAEKRRYWAYHLRSDRLK
jgi:hypothetical protein